MKSAERPEQQAGATIAERFDGRKPLLDIVGFSAPWRPFASHERGPDTSRRT